MAPTVSLHDVVNEMDVMSEEYTAYINRKTGELVTLSEEDILLAEGDEDADELAEGEQDLLPRIREVIESDDYVELPSKFEIHDWSLMERFCHTVKNTAVQDTLLNVIHGSGAFRYFKDTIHRLDIADDWYRYRQQALEQIAADFLESQNIPFKR